MSLPETYKAIHPDGNGDPIIKEFPLQEPSTNQVLVRVEYTPLNAWEFQFLKWGQPSNPESLHYGTEGAGTIAAVGSDLKKAFKVGDRVLVRSGAWSQYLLAKSEEVFPLLQNDISLEDACAHWVNPLTVHYMGSIAEKGGHKAVIFTAAGSELGRMAIKYFNLKGIKLIGVVRRQEQIEELKKEGADYVLNLKDANFEDQLKEVAEKENATLAFDAICGDLANTILKSLLPGAKYMVYGTLGDPTLNNISIMELFKGKTISHVSASNHQNEYISKNELDVLAKELHELLPTVFRTRINKVFELDDLSEALAYRNNISSQGKIALKLN